MPELAHFRWRIDDDLQGYHWSDWHSLTGPCSACCCFPPRDGEHHSGTMSYDEDGILTADHSYFDPAKDDARDAEWQ